MSLKESLKKIKWLGSFVRGCKDFAKDCGAIPGYLAERRIKRTGPAKVVFLCQYIPVWHKLEPVYLQMKQDPAFEPVLLCVPSNMENSQLVGETAKNDTLEYFHRQGYPEAVSALQEDGSWVDLKQLQPSFVFYPRPYGTFMPPAYQIRKVSRFSKVCMVFYGINFSEEMLQTTINRTFYRYVYCFFAELPFVRRYNARSGWLLHLLGLQKSKYFGMPGIEKTLEAKGKHSPSWDFSQGGFRAMWTPRWTTDKSLGGSNFFTYYRWLFAYARQHPEVELLFRPHPLTLQHFQQTGEMTPQEAEEFLHLCETMPNVSLDAQKDYTATIWETDVLISDVSGLVPEYCATGKPLIFCASNCELKLEPTLRRLLEGSYVVNNADELHACLEDLRRGIDPKAELRAEIHGEIFSEELCYPSKHMVKFLKK